MPGQSLTLHLASFCSLFKSSTYPREGRASGPHFSPWEGKLWFREVNQRAPGYTIRRATRPADDSDLRARSFLPHCQKLGQDLNEASIQTWSGGRRNKKDGLGRGQKKQVRNKQLLRYNNLAKFKCVKRFRMIHNACRLMQMTCKRCRKT